MKFTFKTNKPTGRWRCFDPVHTEIKLNKICVGWISSSDYKIWLSVKKKDIMEDGNSNCAYKNIGLKKNSSSLQEVKDFLNDNIDEILEKWELKQEE